MLIKTFILLIFLSLNTLWCRVSFDPIYSDNMLLQRDANIPVTGNATDEKSVTVNFKGKDYTSEVIQGRWKVTLPPTVAWGSHTLRAKGSDSITLKNITFGDVWLCAGQSNIDSMIINYKKNFPEFYQGHPQKNYNHKIRLFKVQKISADQAQKSVQRDAKFNLGWYLLNPNQSKFFSAVGYFFGLHLSQKVNVPIGLIHAAKGGTPITSWLPEGSLQKRSLYSKILSDHKNSMEAWSNNKKIYEQKIKEWITKHNPENKSFWEQSVKVRSLKPQMPMGPENPNRIHAWHKGMIAALHQLPIKGILWYQGEGSTSNKERSSLYAQQLQDLVSEWRAKWQQKDLPFLVVQLPNFRKQIKNPKPAELWPLTRESQKNVEELPHTKAVCTIDSGLANDIHPPNKENVGKRLAYAARRLVYGQKDAPQSPEYESHLSQGESTLITFKNCSKGLSSKGTKNELHGFIVADQSGQLKRAKAHISSSNQVLLQHPGIINPKLIRYAWENNPNCNLYGKDDMPAFPFRTDK